MRFRVTLNRAVVEEVTVNYSTRPSSPESAQHSNPHADYEAASGTLSFSPGVLEKEIEVTVIDDNWDEALTELMETYLHEPTNATLNDPVGVGTITDDDTVPKASLVPSAESDNLEGDQNGTDGHYEIRLDHPSQLPITIRVKISEFSDPDYVSASGGADFAESASDAWEIHPYISSKAATFHILGDVIDEETEYLSGEIVGADNAEFWADAVPFAIGDNDASPSLSLGNVTVTEGTGDGETIAQVPVILSGPTERTIYVAYASADATATTEDDDYAEANSILTISPGQPAYIPVVVIRDAWVEPDETLKVVVESATNATLPSATVEGTVTIHTDDMGAYVQSPANQDTTEGVTIAPLTLAWNGTDSGSGTATITVSGLPGGLTFDAGDNCIKGKVRYDAVTSGNQSFPVTVLATNGAGGVSRTKFDWKINNASVATLTGSEINGDNLIPTNRSVSANSGETAGIYLAAAPAFYSWNNRLRLSYLPGPDGSPQADDILFEAPTEDGPPHRGNFATVPVVIPKATGWTTIAVGVDINDDGNLDWSEKTHRIDATYLTLTNPTIESKGPDESAFATITTTTTYEIFDPVDFHLRGTNVESSGFPNPVKMQLVNIDPVRTVGATRHGITTNHKFEEWWVIGVKQVIFYIDKNGDGNLGSSEQKVESAQFSVSESIPEFDKLAPDTNSITPLGDSVVFISDAVSGQADYEGLRAASPASTEVIQGISSWDAVVAHLEQDYADGSLNAIYLSGHGWAGGQGIRCSGGYLGPTLSPSQLEVIGRKLSTNGILAFMGCGAAAPANDTVAKAFKKLAFDIGHDVIGNTGEWYIGQFTGNGFMVRYLH
ncbi:MAG: Calx-beta domain-containing protein [Pirellulaceae bacterium]